MFKSLVNLISGDPNKKVIDQLRPRVIAVGEWESKLESLSDDGLRQMTADLRAIVEPIEDDEELETKLVDILPQAYALVREASRRTTGLRHYDVQMMGGTLLNEGQIIEMRTGEGKTLVATLPLFLNALPGRGAHLVTVNEYLVRRDGGWMGQIFSFLGMTVGCIGPQQFSAVYDPDYVNPGAELEDDRLVHWRPCTRKEAYEADITYGTSSEFGFDYLRDNMVKNPDNLVQRTPNFAVIDESDNVLIDEARTPLIISGPANQASEDYLRFAQFVRGLKRNTADTDEGEEPNGHYDIDEKSRSITLTEPGTAKIEEAIPEIDVEAGDSLYDPRFFHMTFYLNNALKAQYMFKKDKDYAVMDGEVVIIDDFTGRLMAGRRYSDGLHEAIEAKEKVTVKRESITVATITIQNYFRLYRKIAGMTGTAMTDAEEFNEIYQVEVTPLPTNVEYQATYEENKLKAVKKREDGIEKITYLDPQSNEPRFFKRSDFPDQVYVNEEAKDTAIIEEVKRVHTTGQPVLVGTTSVEHSERIHNLLRREKIDHNVLNATRNQSEALIVSQAGRRGAVTISTNMAGRGTDILLGGNAEGLAAELIEKKLFSREQLTALTEALINNGADKAAQVATKSPKLDAGLVGKIEETHTRFEAALEQIESTDIAGYLTQFLQQTHNIDYNDATQIVRLVQRGAKDAARDTLKSIGEDTILVDEIDKQNSELSRYQTARLDNKRLIEFLSEQTFEEHYNARAALTRAVLGGDIETAQSLSERIPALPSSLISDIQGLIDQAVEERQHVWHLGGLHVIGSERHESRRIDNQLRGRAGRQGDPGSSRFFLSLEDDLMRRFGGERLRSIMNRGLPPDQAIESGIIDRLIASSQERIEGYNFDIRKNVLEYDDVMARQRESIYDDRRSVLTGTADTEQKISEAFDIIIDELVDNYLDNYIPFLEGEIDRVLLNFSNQETGAVYLRGVLNSLRNLLPVHELDQEELEGVLSDELNDILIDLAKGNIDEGRNVYQMLQALGRFVPLLPRIPNIAALLGGRKTGHVQALATIQKRFEGEVKDVFNSFLATFTDEASKDTIWNDTEKGIQNAFGRLSVERATQEQLNAQNVLFRREVNQVLRTYLVDSLSALDADELVEALGQYVDGERSKWRARIGEESYSDFVRTLILNAIDSEWRDYLTAADDLRRDIALESAGRQRDPKLEYKKRSFEMFADMKTNIQKNIAGDFFIRIQRHDEYLRQQKAAVAYRTQLQDSGYSMVQNKKGAVELRRDVPKVGRNDPCPCGSGKKYKACHGKSAATPSMAAATGVKPKKASTRKKRRRR